MPTTPQNPGDYVTEKNAFPNAIAQVATAIPAFVGYTQYAHNGDQSLLNVPFRIRSMGDYYHYFGQGPQLRFALVEGVSSPSANAIALPGGKKYSLERMSPACILYWSMLFYYQNGGGDCYIVSVGDYTATPDAEAMMHGIDVLMSEPDPTIIVVPDAVMLDCVDECARVQNHSVAHCSKMRDRFAILDIFDGFKPRSEKPDCISAFRGGLDADDLSYAAAYYPWLETTIVQDDDLGVSNFDATGTGTLQAVLREELGLVGMPPEGSQDKQRLEWIQKLDGEHWTKEESLDLEHYEALLHNKLVEMSPMYVRLLELIKQTTNRLPPGAALAGVYANVDSTRGVWKAPANVSLAGVVRPTVAISTDAQQDLNSPVEGRAINAIRTFAGSGTLVWGARTLDGNSQDWRYINVRRTLIMLEQSIEIATRPYVFEPNDANTWSKIEGVIRHFLTGIWKQGGLSGATPDDAFGVRVGLGVTMTAEDIQNGILNIRVFFAPVRPAEFVVFTIRKQMQQS